MQTNIKWSQSIKVGELLLRNRIMMAALTRCRTDPNLNIPTQLNAAYYAQRAGAGLILSQATAVSQRGQGFYGAASLWNQKHAQGWKKVVEAVHKKNGIIFAQLFHAGRSTFQKLNKGLQVHAPSAVARRQKMHGFGEFPVPKEMTLEDIQTAKEEFRKSITLAKEVGFDGVQVHGAHGYLIDNFIKTSSNKRTDAYGGSAENRGRFCLQIVDIAIEIFGRGRVGIKFSPTSRAGDQCDDNPVETYTYLVKELEKRHIAFIEFRESLKVDPTPNLYGIEPYDQIADICKTFRPLYSGVIVANNGFTPQSGLEKLNSGNADMVSFGKLYISNPDLAQRILHKHPVNYNWNVKTFYNPTLGAQGYTTYPYYDESKL